MTAKLVRYNTETAAPENDIAESIETTDNQTFTVKLKAGYKFHDGTEVKAKNFVDAWNYTAYGPNGQAGSYFYAPVEGYDDVQCPDERVQGQAQGRDDVGLKVVDDYTFTIKTTEPVSNLPVRLGYSAFSPLPDSFFADPKAFEKKPIGAGPFKMDSSSNTEFVLSKFADYSGATKPNVDKLTFRIYQDPRRPTPTPWPATSTTSIRQHSAGPIHRRRVQDRLPGPERPVESGRVRRGSGSPPPDPQLKDKPELRKAISRAIDRDLITKQIWSTVRSRRPPAGSRQRWMATRPTVSALRPATSMQRRPSRPTRRPVATRAP